MPSYVPNAFAGQSAQAGALRGYAPNPFAGSTPQLTGAMAPHLSVAAADRPHASDIALLQGAPEYASQLPDLDKMWRFSPNTYQTSVANLLREPNAASALETLKARNAPPDYARDEEGNIRYHTDEEGNRAPIIRRISDGGGD